MILFEDGRQFEIAGTVIVSADTIIPFSAITLGAKPSDFPLATTGVSPPIMYVELIIVGDGTYLAAMSVADYSKLALAQAAPIAQPILNQLASAIVRRCTSCGKR